MKNKRIEVIIWICAALPLAATLCLFPILPQQIPLHWNVNGEIDAYGSRFSALATGGLSLGLAALLQFLPRIDPKRANYEKFGTAYNAFRLALALFFIVMQGATLYAAFDPTGIRMESVITASLGVLLCVIGNFMPKFKHNYFVGIKTPWTLANTECWRRTHRFAAPLWVLGGILTILCSFFTGKSVLMFAEIGIITVIVLVPFLYSYLIYKKCAED